MDLPIFYKRLLWATYLTAGMLLVWIGLNTWLSSSVWMGMRISQSALTVEYCEFNHLNRFFHQPINTYSNLAYFFLGVLILQIAGDDVKNQGKSGLNRLESFPLLSVVTGGCFLYLSIGSAFFHASLTYIGQRVDMNATYSILLTLVAIALYHVFYRLTLTSVQKKRWVVSLLAVIILFFQLALWVPSAQLVPALILLLNGLMVIHYVQFRNERSIWLVILGFVLVVIAIRIRTLDVQKVGCDPHSFFQGHALWHALTALSSFCSYSFFRFTFNAGHTRSES
ncbi:ceramidase domain-containing protein [Spirosoma validum]|uniref:Ceramidase domain-containing protein n=1 Tax=Spirosoma validum TaxID=2771355 RepID=A0A927GCZ2_9BACT|nr:ceramidase domain-containing protein [Spirosoma validum]MBD2753011.1 ceramidase domain-containing protein [Spirosoma validum]